MKVWPKQSGKDISYGRITQNAIFAMLADMYLWIDDYSNAEKYAQMVIDYKTDYFKNNYSSYYMVNGYPLIRTMTIPFCRQVRLMNITSVKAVAREHF